MALSNSQHNRISAVYDERFYKRQHLFDKRLREVYIKIPEYKELDASIASLNVSKGKLMLFGDYDKIKEIDARISEVRCRKNDLLCQYGFGVHYLDIPYECEICKDTGYINETPCSCFNKLASTMLCKEAMSIDGYNHHSFDNFNYDLYNSTIIDNTLKITPYDNAIASVKKAKQFVHDFNTSYNLRERKNLFIYGTTGVGKTYLSNCIAKELIESGHKVMYISAPAMFELMSDYAYNKDPDNTDLRTKLNKIKNDELLILDDLGTELNNTFTQTQLYMLLNERLNKGLSTVITSNIHIAQLKDKYDERIYSRVVGEYSLIKLIGEDLRLKTH